MADETLEKVSRKFIHDVRTPLSVLQMLSDLFASSAPSPEDIGIMKEEIGKMTDMIAKYAEDVKAFYR